MRKILGIAVVAVLMAGSVEASTIQARLVATADATAGTWNVAIQYRTSQTTNGSGGDGGLAGAQFDILSVGHNKSNGKPIGPTGPNFTKVVNTWDAAFQSGFNLSGPAKQDALPAQNPGNALYDNDGDFDSLGTSVSDPTAGSNKYQLGYNLTGNNWQTVATQQFVLVDPLGSDSLQLVIKGPLYYDFNNTAQNFQTAFTTVDAGSPVVIGAVPEPTSIALLAMGGVGAVVVARRRRHA